MNAVTHSGGSDLPVNSVTQSGGSDLLMNAVICLNLSDCSETADLNTSLMLQVQH
jgi:hypothetical protein